jgi:hypothetical protein
MKAYDHNDGKYGEKFLVLFFFHGVERKKIKMHVEL